MSGILIALMGAKATGRGQYVDTAMFDGAISLMGWNASGYFATGEDVEPESGILLGQLACYNVYETRDGRYMSIGGVEAHLWANFCNVIGRPRVRRMAARPLPPGRDEGGDLPHLQGKDACRVEGVPRGRGLLLVARGHGGRGAGGPADQGPRHGHRDDPTPGASTAP